MIIDYTAPNLLIFVPLSKFVIGHRPILVLEAVEVELSILMIMVFIYDTLHLL